MRHGLVIFLVVVAGMWAVSTPHHTPLDQQAPQSASREASTPDATWQARVEQGIATSEYQPWRDSEGGLATVNRAQALRGHFASNAVTVTPRAGDASWTVRLETVGWGRGDAAQDMRSGEPRVGACASSGAVDVYGDCLRRVELARGPGLTEWWENRPEGLEQGWTWEQQPKGTGRLFVDVDVDGARVAHLDASGAELVALDGTRLHYGQLKAWDADARPLEVRWKQRGAGVRLELDDRGARYPVTLDPLLWSTPWTAQSESSSAWFGTSVSAAGDVNGDGYGDIIVGAPYFDRGTVNEGRVFVYHGSSKGLEAFPAWTAVGEQAGTHFGVSVAGAGDVNGDGFSDVLVGGHTFSATHDDQGHAALYFGTAKGLQEAAAWMISGNGEGSFFGISVAGPGDVNGDGFSDVLVGAPGDDAVYIYYGDSIGPTSKPDWTGQGPKGARFGDAVAHAGDVNGDGLSDFLVGATELSNGQDSEGGAYLFLGGKGGPNAKPAWSIEGEQAEAGLGTSLSGGGDVNGDGFTDILVASPYYDNGEKNEGQVLLFLGGKGGPSQTPSWSIESNQVGAVLGTVANAGDINGDGYADIVAGAYGFKRDKRSGEGRVMVFLGGPEGPPETASWTTDSTQRKASFGNAVAGAGDVNGDGFADILVGAKHWDETRENEGRAFVYYGSASTLANTSSWSRDGSGHTAAGADVNGDGFTDVILGSPSEGRAELFLGSTGGVSSSASWKASAGSRLGTSIAAHGDVNGDGFSDVAIGAPGGAGTVYLYSGQASGLSDKATWTSSNGEAGDQLGASVATGDVNGDGFADLLVGVPGVLDGQGRVDLYLGGETGLSEAPEWSIAGSQAGAETGAQVAILDANGDGLADVAYAAPAFDNGQEDEGRIYVHYGKRGGLPETEKADFEAEANQAGARFGAVLTSAGDVNGDGREDLLVTAPGYDSKRHEDEGRVYLFGGVERGVSRQITWSLLLNKPGARLGTAAASAGDVNGDGYGDIIVAAPEAENKAGDAKGQVSVYLGSAAGLADAPDWTRYVGSASAAVGVGDVNGDGLGEIVVAADRAEIFLADGMGAGNRFAGSPRVRALIQDRPIAAGGFSDERDGFRLALRGRPPVGTLPMRLQVEVKPVGTPFDSTGLSESEAVPSLASDGVEAEVAVRGLEYNTPYHWRARFAFPWSSNPVQGWSRWYYGGHSGAAAGIHVRTAPNRAPIPKGQSLATDEDVPLSITLSAKDHENDTLTYTVVTTTQQGTLSGSGATLTYTPNANISGNDSFEFVVSDGLNESKKGKVELTISAVNDAPVAKALTAITSEERKVTVALEATDIEGDRLSFSVVDSPANGTVTERRDSIVYEPAKDFSGTDSFTYRASDGQANSAPARVSVEVSNINDKPDAQDQSVTVNEDGSLSITLVGTDIDGDTLTYELTSQPRKGSLSGTPPRVTYTPNADYNGRDAFAFKVSDGNATSRSATVSIQVEPVNDAPIAQATSASVTEDRSTTLSLSGSDIDGDTLRYEIAQSPSHGSLSGNPPRLTYTPEPNYNGADAFTFKASDGNASSSAARVEITVEAANDKPEAASETVSLQEDGSASVRLSGSDVDGDSLSYSVASQPRKGTLSGDGASLTYTPNADYNGSDAFTFKVSDGSSSDTGKITLEIASVNDAPRVENGSVSVSEDGSTAITLKGSDPERDTLSYEIVSQPSNGALSGSAPKLKYTPNANYNGSDAFTFRASDGTDSSPNATVQITVNAVNDKPEAASETVSLQEDGSASVRLSGSDVDGDSLSYSVASQPRKGTLSGDGANLTYTPNADYNGSDAFTFKVSDGSSSDTGKITLEIASVNDAPQVKDGSASVSEDGSTSITLEGSDPERDTLSFEIVSQPSNGALSGSAPKLKYTPNANYNGSDSFTFKASDGTDSSPNATVQITVNAVNDKPKAADSQVEVAEDGSVSITLTGSDVDGDSLTFSVKKTPRKGTLSGSGASLTYTPHANYNGSDAFTFEASDGKATASGTVAITVSPVNDAPTAQAAQATVKEDDSVTVSLAGSDVDGDSLTYAVASQPSKGTLSISGSKATYTPNANYHGSDAFTFTVSDGTASSSAQTVSVTVSPVNDAPTASAETGSTSINTPVTIALSGSDVEGSSLSFSVSKKPRKGSVSISGNQATYTPDKDFKGSDSFEIRASDGESKSAAVEVTVEVQ